MLALAKLFLFIQAHSIKYRKALNGLDLSEIAEDQGLRYLHRIHINGVYTFRQKEVRMHFRKESDSRVAGYEG